MLKLSFFFHLEIGKKICIKKKHLRDTVQSRGGKGREGSQGVRHRCRGSGETSPNYTWDVRERHTARLPSRKGVWGISVLGKVLRFIPK